MLIASPPLGWPKRLYAFEPAPRCGRHVRAYGSAIYHRRVGRCAPSLVPCLARRPFRNPRRGHPLPGWPGTRLRVPRRSRAFPRAREGHLSCARSRGRGRPIDQYVFEVALRPSPAPNAPSNNSRVTPRRRGAISPDASAVAASLSLQASRAILTATSRHARESSPQSLQPAAHGTPGRLSRSVTTLSTRGGLGVDARLRDLDRA